MYCGHVGKSKSFGVYLDVLRAAMNAHLELKLASATEGLFGAEVAGVHKKAEVRSYPGIHV